MAGMDIQKLRNVGILGHGGSGKTSLGEALLFAAGATPRLGRVDDGSSVLNFEPEEIKRQVTITTALHTLNWKKVSVNLLDTPGYAAFFSDAIYCMHAFGGAVFLLSPSDGLRVEGEKLWAHSKDRNIRKILFVGRMDSEKSEVEGAINEILTGLEAKGVSLQMPIGLGESFRGIIDLLEMKAFIFEGGDGKFSSGEIPGDLKEEAQEKRTQLMENVAETDDALLEKYLDAQELSIEELKRGIRQGVQEGKLFPILYGSAQRLIGISQLLDAIVDYLPSPIDEGDIEGQNPVTGESEKRSPDPEGSFSAYVFKTIVDPFAGKLSVLRMVSGKLGTDMTVYNSNRDTKEKIGQLFRLEGKKQEQVQQAYAGEIVAAAKLKEANTGDTLCDERAPVRFPDPVSFTPMISFALEPKSRNDEEKAPQGLQRLIEEDPTIGMHRDQQTREIILSGMGQLHIEVVVEKLKRKYGAEVELKAPKVPYKETIKGSASSQGKYKRQSGGRGQYGDTWLKIEPLPRGKGFEFVDKIVGGAIPRNYIPAVEKGIREAMAGGYLAGYPLVDIRATLYDGSYHEVDSSDMAFKIAASMGFKNAVEKSKPIILEPVMTMEVTVPDECMGDVIGDLNSRRGKVLGVETKGHSQTIKAQVPMSEVLKYAPDLRSMTSGRGEFQMEFSHYGELPSHLAEKLVKETKAAAGADAKG